MRGLLLHDYYCMKPQINLFIRVLLITFIISLLLLLGMKYGNLKDLVADDDEAFEMLAMTFDMLLPFVCGLIPFFLVEWKLTNDKKSGWDKYYFSLPVSDKLKLCAPYVISIIATVITFIISISFSMVFNVIAGTFTENGIASLKVAFNIFFTAVTLSYILIAAHFIIRNKIKLAILSFSTFIGGYILLVTVIIYSDGLMDVYMKVIEFIDKIYTDYFYTVALFSVLIGALSYGVSYLATKTRREKLCK